MFTYKSTFDSDLYKSTTDTSPFNLEKFEDEKFHIYSMKVPYFAKEDLTVTFKKGKLIVNGEKKVYNHTVKIDNSFIVNPDYDVDDIIVEYDSGVLFFKFPKTIVKKGTKELTIK